jgi:diguanylate cyclase (GGDEF)-like protein
MKNQLPKKWINNLKILDIAFQPILNIHTGQSYAVEALLRNFRELGFESIFSLFDKVYQEGILYSFDIALREKTIQKFTEIDNYEELKLFYNLDNRLFEMDDFKKGNTEKLLKKFNVKKENICFEISERHEIPDYCDVSTVLSHYQDEDFCIALDDFGMGHSGYKLLYETAPNILKIDRFFLHNIEHSMKKKLMVRNITNLSIQLGIKVVAEGVETKEELLTCKDIGCHLVQGYLVQKPTLNTQDISQEYQNIIDLIENDKRVSDTDSKIKAHLIKTTSLNVKTKMNQVVDYFKNNPTISVVPIVDSNNEPIGILDEKQIKDFLYSPFGIALLTNDNESKAKLKHLLKPCGVTDINSDISTIIELFSNNPEAVGIIITKNSKYHGYLTARAIITIMNDENLIYAREQNPLTKLPGNTMIERYIDNISKNNSNTILCYYDLDNFKAFNDVYGFRNGDRVILLFAQILRKYLSNDFFIAHIGGDDFFAAVEYNNTNQLDKIGQILNTIHKFTLDVKSFYSQEDREQGYIVSKDRDNNSKKFPLLTVSASIVSLHTNTNERNINNINSVLSIQKKVAKQASNNIAISSLI